MTETRTEGSGPGQQAASGQAGADDWWFQRSWNGFRRGTARARLSWAEGSADVTVYDEGAPETAAAFLAALPIEMPFVHAAWSGEMIMGTRTLQFAPRGPENSTRLVRPGDLTWDPKYGELCVTYGDAECRLPSGTNTVVVFGQVSRNLDGIAAFCRRRRFDGAASLRLESWQGAG